MGPKLHAVAASPGPKRSGYASDAAVSNSLSTAPTSNTYWPLSSPRLSEYPATTWE